MLRRDVKSGDKLTCWARLSAKELQQLEAAKIVSVHDLLVRLPRRYEDRTQGGSLANIQLNQANCLRVQVYATAWRFGAKKYFEVSVGEEGQPYGARLCLRWFHMPWIHKLIATGQRLYIYGVVKPFGKSITMVNPDFELLEDDTGQRLAQLAMGGDEMPPVSEPTQTIHINRIVPIYRAISGITAHRYREIMWQLMGDLSEFEPPIYEVAASYPLSAAVREVHFPQSADLAHKARMRFALEECFYQQFRVLWRRSNARRKSGQITAATDYYWQELRQKLPFELTGAQQRCLSEIVADMRAPQPMNRLLQGDVGSGKTLVALAAMLMAFEAGHHAVLMAPTQILAEQHYRNFCKLLEGMDVGVSLRTSEYSEESDGLWEQGSAPNAPRLIVGTHALLYKAKRVEQAGLVVIDEQHKFGVEQRARLMDMALPPDVLVMTATPIPRTLTLTLYGDLDISLLDELPAQRQSISTAMRHPKRIKKLIEFMREQLAEGRQIYIVSSLIEESETRDQRAATKEWERWREEFSEYEVALLHGRLSAKQKEEVMQDFASNKAQVLVATTVVEVGVDVPNATLMLINDADSFGLAQLHQLRGRIGRGAYKSYCVLLSEAKQGSPGFMKLEVLCRTRNGFEIAEEDFKLRGPGEVLGTAQSGLGSVVFAEWLSDARLIYRARREVEAILSRDPLLREAAHAGLRSLVLGEQEEGVTS